MKKLISMAVVLCMIFCMLPMIANAAEPQEVASGHVDLPNSYTNEGLTFTAPGNGVLTVAISNADPGCEVGFGPVMGLEYQQGGAEAVFNYDVVSGTTYEIQFWGYNYATGEWTAASYDYVVTYTGEGVVGEAAPAPVEGTTAEMPISLYMPSGFANVPASSTYYFSYSPMAMAMQQVLTIYGAPGFDVVLSAWDWNAGAVVDTHYSDDNGFLEVTLDANMTMSFAFAIENKTDMDQMYMYTFSDPSIGGGDGDDNAEGTMGNPIIIESLPYEVTVDGTHDLYYSWTAGQDGTIAITFPEGNYVSGLLEYEKDDVNLVYTAPVVAGETYTINPWGDNAGTYVIDWTTDDGGDQGGDVGGGEGNQPAPEGAPLSGTVEMDSEMAGDSTVVYVEAPTTGTISITVSGTPGYAFYIIDPNGEYMDFMRSGDVETVYSYEASVPGFYTVELMSYNPELWGFGTGTVTYDIAFNAGEVVVDKPAYEISDVVINRPGTYEVPMLNAEVTIFTFYPVETGVYLISVGENDLVGYYGGGSWYIYDSAIVEHGTSMEWTCSEAPTIEYDTILDENWNEIQIERLNDGQTAMVGIISESDVVSVTIEKIGEYVPPIEETMQWTEYTSEEDFVSVKPAEGKDYVSIDVVEDASTVIVLGEDGYYHYGASDGPIVVIDLSYSDNFPISITEAMGYNVVGYWQYVDDQLVAKHDCGNYLASLQAAGPVALTDEILNVVINVGNNSGWWFMAAGGEYMMHPNAWLSLCAYADGTNNVDTGDMIGVVVALLVVSGMGITVLKKREF